MQSPTSVTTHKGLPLELLCGRYEDLPESMQHFIIDSYVRQHSHFFPSGTWESNNKRKDALRKHMTGLLKNESTHCAVVLFPDENLPVQEKRIVGWSVFGGGVLHYVLVRQPYRHAGAGQLLAALASPGVLVAAVRGVPCSHWSKKLPLVGSFRIGESLFTYVGSDPIPQPR